LRLPPVKLEFYRIIVILYSRRVGIRIAYLFIEVTMGQRCLGVFGLRLEMIIKKTHKSKSCL